MGNSYLMKFTNLIILNSTLNLMPYEEFHSLFETVYDLTNMKAVWCFTATVFISEQVCYLTKRNLLYSHLVSN